MKLHPALVEELAVKPGDPAGLEKRSTTATSGSFLDPNGTVSAKKLAEGHLEIFKDELATAQELLYAAHSHALLVIFQAPDAAGKDGTIKHVMSGVNPQGCSVSSFKVPSGEELDHDFLWRCSKVLPERGRIGIFNRSYYEEVLVARVHPEVLAGEGLPLVAGHGEKLWAARYEDINAFERHLVRNGTRVVKFFLHVSKGEQKKRLLERLEDPAKYWKFSSADLAGRAYFGDYQRAYEVAITATSTPWAPWYVVPADHKYLMRALVAGVLTHTVEQLDLHLPKASPEQRAEIEQHRQALLAE